MEGNLLLLLDVLKEGTMFSFSVSPGDAKNHSLSHARPVSSRRGGGWRGREGIAFTRNQQVVDKQARKEGSKSARSFTE